uniref:small monomeric GTPase n=1 Tax=Lygus hesperus TaxID=30085 RepID=A0A0A9XSA8_LYGHE
MSGKSPHKNCLLKVIILGDGGVGKSCLMNRFVNNHFDDHSFHTIGVEFLNKEMKIKNEMYTLQIWDTAGQERFKSLRTPFYRGSDICMLTYAVDDKTSFQSLGMWKNEFIYYSDIKDGSAFPFVVVANKVDISEEKRQVSEVEARNWCKENGDLPYIETSAKDAINVDLAFNMAVDIWSLLEAEMDKQGMSNDTIRIDPNRNGKREACCGL